MKKILFLSVIMLTVFTFSCASKSDYQQNNFEIAKLKNDSKRLHNDMVLFKKAYNAAMQAAEKAGSAEQSADYIAEYVNLINRQTRSLNRIQDKIKTLDIKIRKISTRLDEMDKAESKITSGKITKH